MSDVPLVIMNRLSYYLYGLITVEAKNDNRQTLPAIFFSEPINDSSNEILQEEFKHAIITTSCEMSKKRTVYLVRPIPEMGVNIPRTLSRNLLFGHNRMDIKITLEEYHQRHKLVWEAQDQAADQCGVRILNPLPYLCDEKYCYGSRNGRPLYYDDNHLSEYGNKYLVPMFDQVFKDSNVQGISIENKN